MSYRQTFVIEYPDSSSAPAVGANMQMLGGDLVACQFDDALEELEALLECIRPNDLSRAEEMRRQMKSKRGGM